MTDLLRLLEDDEKGTSLPALMSRFIEAYECSPNRAAYVLKFKHLLGRNDDSVKLVNSRTAEALSVSAKSSALDTFERTLHSPAKYTKSYEQLLDDWYRGNLWDLQEELTEDAATSLESDYELSEEERTTRGQILDGPRYMACVEEYAKDLEVNQTLKDSVAQKLGVDVSIPAFDLALRTYQESSNAVEKSHFERLRTVKPVVSWAKELVGRLDEIVLRQETLTRHPIASLGADVPSSISALWEQAHLAYLFDFDIPCILTCGSLIEEAWEKKFPEEYKNDRESQSFMSKVSRLKERYGYGNTVTDLSRAIWAVRNETMHSPDKYLNTGKLESEKTLRKSRELLAILFEQEQPSEGRK